VARFFLNFTQSESCGKCIFCRIGTRRMLEILDRITSGEGKEGDIELLDDLAHKIQTTSLCGLGQTAPNPVLTTVRYFREEYEAHIRDRRCPSHVCAPLLIYSIDAAVCTGCTLCARSCPVGAITGEKKKAHTLDAAKCSKCGKCFITCPSGAVVKD